MDSFYWLQYWHSQGRKVAGCVYGRLGNAGTNKYVIIFSLTLYYDQARDVMYRCNMIPETSLGQAPEIRCGFLALTNPVLNILFGSKWLFFIFANTITCAQQLYYFYEDGIKWKHFPRYWPFVRGIRRSMMNSPHKVQWRGALMFSLISLWINAWVNNREAGDFRRHRTHYDVTNAVVIFGYTLINHTVSCDTYNELYALCYYYYSKIISIDAPDNSFMKC